jgi:hypothetical protein
MTALTGNETLQVLGQDGAGHPAAATQQVTTQQIANLAPITPAGLTVVIVTAKLTGGGANGSMTFTNGVLTAQTPAT